MVYSVASFKSIDRYSDLEQGVRIAVTPAIPPPLLYLHPKPVGLVSGSDERVVVALEELIDLKGVWSELSKVWEKIEEMREKPWLSVAPRKIRQGLDVLVQQLRGFPARLKSYASFEYVQATLKGYMKVYMEGVFIGEPVTSSLSTWVPRVASCPSVQCVCFCSNNVL